MRHNQRQKTKNIILLRCTQYITTYTFKTYALAFFFRFRIFIWVNMTCKVEKQKTCKFIWPYGENVQDQKESFVMNQMGH